MEKKVKPSRFKPDPRPIDWEAVTDDELLAKRICDLPLKIEGTELEERIRIVYDELEAKGFSLRPPVYLGDEWFSPEGDPVVAIPYYLAHPRLIRLERSRVLEAEGDTKAWFLRLLRHEMGHAVSHAYELHLHKGYDRIFGSSEKDYPESFYPKPYSRRFVKHLEDWYAQVHPDEDFAETFAVWLTPGIDWRARYAGWPALRKLEWVESAAAAIRETKPKRRTGPRYRRLSTIRMTISQAHRLKHKDLEEYFPDYFDKDLRFIFGGVDDKDAERAAAFLRRHRGELVEMISRWSGEKRYTVKNFVTRLAERCEELKLSVVNPDAQSLAAAASFIATLTSSHFMTGKFRRPKRSV